MDHAVAVLAGPSFVGKSTLIRWLVVNADYRVAELVSTRPPRLGERADAAMGFVDDEAMDALARSADWLVFDSTGARYAVNLGAVARLRRDGRVLVGVIPAWLDLVAAAIPGAVRVLVWPDDFAAMQDGLLRDGSRPADHRAERARLNDAMAAGRPDCDLLLCLSRRGGTPLEQRLEQAARDLNAALVDAGSRYSSP